MERGFAKTKIDISFIEKRGIILFIRKDDLKPFIKDSSTEPDSIGVLAITGRDE